MKIYLSGFAVILIAAPFYAQASQSMTAPECTVQGVVISAAQREEDGRGMSEGQSFEYLDISVRVMQSGFAVEAEGEQFAAMAPPFHCGLETGGVVVYQARDPDIFSHAEGVCITAKSKFHADGNFRSGNWIYDIEALPAGECE